MDARIPTVREGRTTNVATAGLYFETAEAGLEVGDLAEVRLSIPPKAGVLELGGTMSGPVRVVRIDNLGDVTGGSRSGGGQGVAVEFCRRPKPCM
jgi:hypothetical protein